jgi:outer membrane protease
MYCKVKTLQFLICGALCIALTITASAENLKIDVNLGTGMLRGNTTYQIGGTINNPYYGIEEVHFPISELAFPLNVYMVSAEGSLEFAERFQVAARVNKNITNDAGKMEDSDWGVWYLGAELPHMPGRYCLSTYCTSDSLDVFSESDSDLKALIMDIKLSYIFYKQSNWSFMAGLGYIRQNFDYEISNLDQWFPSYYDYFEVDLDHIYESEKVGTYEVTYSIPYIAIGAQLTLLDRLGVVANFGYAPVVNVEDEDHHLLRDKVNKGEGDGTGSFVSVEGQYTFRKNWFVALEADYTKIETEGKSKSFVEDEYDHTIDEKIESEQTSVTLSIGYSF